MTTPADPKAAPVRVRVHTVVEVEVPPAVAADVLAAATRLAETLAGAVRSQKGGQT